MQLRVVINTILSGLLLSTFVGLGGQDSRSQLRSSPFGRIIENFESGRITLTSYPGEDQHPNSWAIDSLRTYGNSRYSLRLYGNTWKIGAIQSTQIDSSDVWQVAAYVQNLAEIQGFGLMDSMNTLFYSFAGSEQVNINVWEAVYQGSMPNNTWNLYRLPVARDWLARFGYLPNITRIVFVNDRDQDPDGVIYFDDIIDITSDLPAAPRVAIEYTSGDIYLDALGRKLIDIQFYSRVIDPDSETHQYYWNFGDDSTSRQQHPFHTFLVVDDHDYTVLLEVVDQTNLWGRASCRVRIEQGRSRFPVRINFVGDVMLGRRYESSGGIIPTQGVNAIFAPTRSILGQAADITVANLECPLTNTGTPHPTKPIVFRSSPANVSGLVYAGIDLVTLANNHIIDYGLVGLRQTQNVLRATNIRFSGAGGDSYEALQPVFASKTGVSIAFLGFSDRTGQYNNYQPYLDAGFSKPGFANLTLFNLQQQIGQARTAADRVVVQLHSGSEYSFLPKSESPWRENDDEDYSNSGFIPQSSDRVLRRLSIDYGADLVINHHPHVVQGFEVYNGKLIAHSLGNYAFDLDYPETMPTFVLNSELRDRGFTRFTVKPVFIDDYIPRPAQGELGIYILDFLSRLSRDLGTYMLVRRDSVVGEIVLDTTRLIPITTTQLDTAITRQQSGFWTSEPMRLAKVGSFSSLASISPIRSWQYRLGRDDLWFGNMENEGCSLWSINDADERYDTTSSIAGRRSIRQRRTTGTTTITTNLENRLMLPDTAGYTLYGWMRTDNSRNANLTVRYYNSRTSFTMLGSVDVGIGVSGTLAWQFYWSDFTPVTGTTFIDYVLRSDGPTSGTGLTWFDNVGLIEWTPWQPFAPGQRFPTPNDFTWLQVRTTTSTPNVIVSYDETGYIEMPNSVEGNAGLEPQEFQLHQNYPNPFNPLTSIEYELPRQTEVTIVVYNILGQKVRTIVDGVMPMGRHIFRWDGTNEAGTPVSSGVYFYRMKASHGMEMRKMLLIR